MIQEEGVCERRLLRVGAREHPFRFDSLAMGVSRRRVVVRPSSLCPVHCVIAEKTSITARSSPALSSSMLLRTAAVAMIMLVSITTTAPVVAEPEGASSASAEPGEPEQPQTFTQQVGAWRFWHSPATETSLCHRVGLLTNAICVIY